MRTTPTLAATSGRKTDIVRSPGDLLTKQELATELRCSLRQIERLQLARRIPFLKISGRMIRYRRSAVLIALTRLETEVAS